MVNLIPLSDLIARLREALDHEIESEYLWRESRARLYLDLVAQGHPSQEAWQRIVLDKTVASLEKLYRRDHADRLCAYLAVTTGEAAARLVEAMGQGRTDEF